MKRADKLKQKQTVDARLLQAIEIIDQAMEFHSDTHFDEASDDTDGSDHMQRAIVALRRAIATPKVREAEYQHALVMLARKGGGMCGGLALDALRQHMLEMAWADDNHGSSADAFYQGYDNADALDERESPI